MTCEPGSPEPLPPSSTYCGSALPAARWIWKKRSELPATIGAVNASAVSTVTTTSFTRAGPGVATNAGSAARTAHCLVVIAQPSSSPASTPFPREATITAATHSAAPSSSSGWPQWMARTESGDRISAAPTIARSASERPARCIRRSSHAASASIAAMIGTEPMT